MNTVFLALFAALLISMNLLYLDNLIANYKDNKKEKLDRSFNRWAYFLLQFLSPAFLFLSILSDHPYIFKLYDGNAAKFAGVLISTIALVLLSISKKALGRNYSPCQDSYVPFSITSEGPYRYVRHPLYSTNILFFSGLTLASGSIWSMIILLCLVYYFNRSAQLEENFLSAQFAEYAAYKRQTKRFIPFVY